VRTKRIRDRLGRTSAFLFGFGVAVLAGPASSQPNQSQVNAIRQNCRSDYMSHCSSVKPGGPEALHCLENNAARLSSACRNAVDALKPAAAPAQPSPAAAPAAKPAAKPADAPPQQRAVTAPTSPAPTAPAVQSPRKPAAKPEPARAKPKAPAVAAPPEPLPPAYEPMPPLRPRVQLAIIRACEGDRQAICRTVPMGGGRVIECLARNEPSLSPFCRETMTAARATAGR
jgi:hypothetical protein